MVLDDFDISGIANGRETRFPKPQPLTPAVWLLLLHIT
jgi:hypothetical protein